MADTDTALVDAPDELWMVICGRACVGYTDRADSEHMSRAMGYPLERYVRAHLAAQQGDGARANELEMHRRALLQVRVALGPQPKGANKMNDSTMKTHPFNLATYKPEDKLVCGLDAVTDIIVGTNCVGGIVEFFGQRNVWRWDKDGQPEDDECDVLEVIIES